jgi:hypothetical protein
MIVGTLAKTIMAARGKKLVFKADEAKTAEPEEKK